MTSHPYDCDCAPCVAMEKYVAKIVAEAPPLTDEQRMKLATLLKPVRIRSAGSHTGDHE